MVKVHVNGKGLLKMGYRYRRTRSISNLDTLALTTLPTPTVSENAIINAFVGGERDGLDDWGGENR